MACSATSTREGHFATVLPRGPVAAPPGFSWYDMTADPGAGFAEALAAIDDLLDAACEEHGFARSEAVVGGFSPGRRGSRWRWPSGRASGRGRPGCSP